MTDTSSCRLSSDVHFTHYDVAITPNFDDFTFAGEVTIECTINRPTRAITLHAADLNFAQGCASLHRFFANPGAPLGLIEIDATRIELNPNTETVTFTFDEEIPATRMSLHIRYTGTLNDKMAGFYRSAHATADGTKKHLAATQFEPTDARRALPCGDEPALKATFNVTLIVPPGMTALSNMPVRDSIGFENGTRLFEFERTPKMSTYLLAFVVGNLEHSEAFTKNGTCIRVYTVPGKSAHGAFALETARRVLEFYNEYFAIDYPLPKLDMVAIPDFAAGAMENWGLVTYRENTLLIDPENSASYAYQRVANVVAHELAHQWFGNLVTMQWWTHLWLNEGFATWMANFALDRLFPEWDIWTQFVSDDYASALGLDGLRSSHPIEVEVHHPNEINQIFDAISYSKGASIIRMLHDSIGADAFQRGLRTYLTRHAYGNTVTEDLWDALGEVAQKPVREMMNTWTKQAGYPLITVARCGVVGFMTQERFLASGARPTPQESAQQWHIPMTMRPLSADDAKQWSFTFKDKLRYFSTPREPGIFKVNAGQTALVRVNYTKESGLWSRLARALREGALPPVDRYGLISDARALARAGKLPTSQLLEIIANCTSETNYSVWNAILGAMGSVSALVEETPDEEDFDALARTVLAPMAAKLGWDEQPGESHTTQMLRGRILGAMGAYGDNATLAQASQRFSEHIAGHNVLAPNLRATTYGLVARQNRLIDFEVTRSAYEREELQEEKVRLLSALGQFKDAYIMDHALDYAFNSGHVRPGDFSYILSGMQASLVGTRAAWAFITNNWDRVNERFSGGGLKILANVIEAAISGFRDAKDADAIEAFFAEHHAPSATRAIAESVECIRILDAWCQRDRNDIAQFLVKHSS